MFRLLRYFSLTSAIALAVAALALTYLYRVDQVEEHFTLAEQRNIRLGKAFTYTFWPQFAAYFRAARNYDPSTLAGRGETGAVRTALETLTRGFYTIEVKIFTPDGLTLFAPSEEEIGRYRDPHSDLFSRAVRGEPGSKLEVEDTARPGRPRSFVVETYVPVYGESGTLEGVFELYTDVTPEMERLQSRTIRLMVIIGSGFLALYGVLFLIVQRADRILRSQHEKLRERERKIRESEQRFRSVTQSADDSIISADSGGRIVSWNLGAERMFGFAEGEVMGEPVSIIVPERYRAAHERALDRNRRTGQSTVLGQTLELEGLRRDGREFPLEVVLSRWETEGRIYYTAIARDVTDRRKAEEDLHRTMDELVRSNAELERFAYVASHDLQEPVRTLVSYSQLLDRRLKGELDEDTRDYLQFVTDGAKRLHTLIRDLLAYSRVGHQDSVFVGVDCREAVEIASSHLRALVEEHDASVQVDGDLPTIHGNQMQITELFQNLIANGIKFAQMDVPPRVTVRAEPSPDLEDAWIFSVADNGIGIEPEYFDQIFAIFKRLHTAGAYPGTGVGLAICKRIVERHGGSIWLESQLGQGTTFFFTLRSVPSDAESGEEAAE